MASIKAKLKTLNFLWIWLTLAAVLSACNLPGAPSSPTQITGQVPVGSLATLTPQVNPTQIKFVTLTPLATVALSTPGAPVWSVYEYTCELAVGGATMTMNLAWTDHSASEAGYEVYRDGLVIATLAPNATFYVDVAFVATGKTLSYSVEAFKKDWRGSTSTLTYGCQ